MRRKSRVRFVSLIGRHVARVCHARTSQHSTILFIYCTRTSDGRTCKRFPRGRLGVLSECEFECKSECVAANVPSIFIIIQFLRRLHNYGAMRFETARIEMCANVEAAAAEAYCTYETENM